MLFARGKPVMMRSKWPSDRLAARKEHRRHSVSSCGGACPATGAAAASPGAAGTRSGGLERPLGQTEEVPLDGRRDGRLGVGRGAERDEQRREVLDGRMRVRHARGAAAE